MTSNAKEMADSVEWALRGASEELASESDDAQMRALTIPPVAANARVELASAAGAAETTGKNNDWAAAITLVQEAAEAIRYREEKVEELRLEAERQTQQHIADLKALHGQLVAAQKEIEAANARADAAEAEAREANEWLARLNDAITGNLSSIGSI